MFQHNQDVGQDLPLGGCNPRFVIFFYSKNYSGPKADIQTLNPCVFPECVLCVKLPAAAREEK